MIDVQTSRLGTHCRALAEPATLLVFSKVRVADVITPKKGLNQSDWQRAFNAAAAMSFGKPPYLQG